MYSVHTTVQDSRCVFRPLRRRQALGPQQQQQETHHPRHGPHDPLRLIQTCDRTGSQCYLRGEVQFPPRHLPVGLPVGYPASTALVQEARDVPKQPHPTSSLTPISVPLPSLYRPYRQPPPAAGTPAVEAGRQSEVHSHT